METNFKNYFILNIQDTLRHFLLSFRLKINFVKPLFDLIEISLFSFGFDRKNFLGLLFWGKRVAPKLEHLSSVNSF